MYKIDVIYDLELNPNFFLYVGMNIDTKEIYVFEISERKDERFLLLSHLKTLNKMVGFNNLSFDYPIVHFLITQLKHNIPASLFVIKLYDKGQQLINAENRWDGIIKKPFIIQIDLFYINHYDNFAKSTSLKLLEFNMQMTDIQTLPYAYNHSLAFNEMDEVITYCKNDVEATYQFYLKNIAKIKFRNRMSEIYNQNLTNFNDVKIGETILLSSISDNLKIDKFTVNKMRTHRASIKINEIILPYIKFESPQMRILLNWWKNKIIYETKGQFSGLDLEDVAPILPYCNPKTVKGKLKTLNIIIKGFQFDFGTGGLHGTSKPGIWKSDEEGDLILVDVSSYYPNLAAMNKFHPAHIPQEIFTSTILMLYQQRMTARTTGDNEMVAAIKLALNGALYGKSNSEYSFMYDPQFMMSITINGQLLLIMLAEQIMKIDIEIIQVNTDGILVKCPKYKKEQLDAIVANWENITDLKLDYDLFDFIVQRDVNNYLGVFTNGKIKYKGVFDYNYANNGDWHKNFSMLIVAKGLEAYFLHNISPSTFVKNHQDMNDFFIRTKYGKDSKLFMVEGNNKLQLQNITRYYISRTGFEFIKTMNPLKNKVEDREFQVESGFLCREMNHINNENMILMEQDIDYQYYIEKIEDNIEKIEGLLSQDKWSFELID